MERESEKKPGRWEWKQSAHKEYKCVYVQMFGRQVEQQQQSNDKINETHGRLAGQGRVGK